MNDTNSIVELFKSDHNIIRVLDKNIFQLNENAIFNDVCVSTETLWNATSNNYVTHVTL